MKNNSITHPFKPIVDIFKGSSFVLFVVTIVIGLIISVLILSNIMLQPSDSNPTSTTTESTEFDQATIKRLNKLTKSSDSSNNQVLPSDRINPFSG